MIAMLNVLDLKDAQGMTLNSLKKSLGTSDAEVFDMCEQCYSVFPQDESVLRCEKNGCGNTRFKNNQSGKQRKCYFACLSIHSQIKDILERHGNWERLNQHVASCKNSNNFCDIINGQLYKSVMLENECGDDAYLSLMFNTDGVPLYSSSGISIWPVYLVLNELPPMMRFSKKNMVLWGVWQGKGKPKFQTYFKPFVKQIISLRNEGVNFSVGKDRIHGPLTRYVKLQVAHAPGMPGTFSPAADFKGNR